MTLKILFIKTGVPGSIKTAHPPLGPLHLSSSLKKKFSSAVSTSLIDMRLPDFSEEFLNESLASHQIIAFSVMNAESTYSVEQASQIKNKYPNKIIAVGGPWTYKNAYNILSSHSCIDWVFEGEAENTFSQAIECFLNKVPLSSDIKGLAFREANTSNISYNEQHDFISNLDDLPIPDWNLINFDSYMQVNSMNFITKGSRYAPLITSRGCPYKCAYCHGIMGTKVRFRSVSHLFEEITLLIEKFNIDELQIVDDIFNIKKDRVKDFFSTMQKNFPNKTIFFSFPNALRGDLLNEEIIDIFAQNNVYSLTVAFETASPRLQELILKNLDIGQTRSMIAYAHKKKIITKGYFMIGFPTETIKEMFKTFIFAFRCKLDFASFFSVVPQRGTLLHTIASKEAPQVQFTSDDLSYYNNRTWYEQAYGIKIDWLIRTNVLMFYILNPLRLYRLIMLIGIKDFITKSTQGILSLLFRWK